MLKRSTLYIIVFFVSVFSSQFGYCGMFENCAAGKLKVIVKSSTNGMPIAGATVRIDSRRHMGTSVAQVVKPWGKTDENGVVFLKTVGYVSAGPADLKGSDSFTIKAWQSGFKESYVNGNFTSCDPEPVYIYLNQN